MKILPSITYREGAFKSYLKEVNKYSLLNIEEEYDLARKIQDGNQTALHTLVCANLRFVISVVNNERYSKTLYPDLVSEGNIGLMEAANRFDASKGVRFISFAIWHIKRYLYNYLQLKNLIRLPFNQLITLSKINKVIFEFEKVNHRVPTNHEIVELSGLSLNRVKFSRSPIIPVVSFDEYISEDGSLTLIDTIVNENSPKADEIVELDSIAKNRLNLLNILPSRNIDIIEMFFGLGNCTALTLYEISVKVNLSTERTRQIKDNSIMQARLAVKNKRPFSDYL